MGLVFNWWGVPGTLAFIVAWGAAGLALWTAPARSVNRRLAVVLLLDGLFVGAGSGFLFFVDHRETAFLLGIVATAALAAAPFQYLAFLGAALDSPLVRPFRSRRAFVIASLASALMAVLVIAAPHRFITQPYAPGWAPWNYQNAGLGVQVNQLNGLVAFFGLVVAVSAYVRTAHGSAARERAFWFMIAFGVRDLFGTSMQLLYPVIRPLPLWGDLLFNPVRSSFALAYVLLLAYGVLRAQLLGIELTVKVAIQRSTVAAAIAGAFLIGSELLEKLIPVHGTILGIAAAFLIVVALRPIERLARGMADRMMPGVTDTPEYFDARRVAVYCAALEGALQDGVITAREEAILARLRDELAITPEEARDAEEELARYGRCRPLHLEGAA